jgi:hypothetical protein
MVNKSGPTDRQPDNIDTHSLPWIKPNLNYQLRSGKKPRNFISNDSDKFSDLRIYHQNIKGLINKRMNYSVNGIPRHRMYFV